MYRKTREVAVMTYSVNQREEEDISKQAYHNDV